MSAARQFTRFFPEQALAEVHLDALEAALGELTANARARWPDLVVEEARWVAHLASRVEPKRCLESLAALDGPGLYLACACLGGDESAFRALERELLPESAEGLRRLGLTASATDEVLQLAREHLLVGADGISGRLARYAGRGPLGAWLRTVCARLAADLHSKKQPETDSEERLLAVPGSSNPEIDLIRADHREHFSTAFVAALASLTPRQRTLLRFSLVEHLSIDQIAPIYAVSRATVARWIHSAKHDLARQTQRQLAATLKLGAVELESLMGTLVSRMDVSIVRHLNEADQKGS